MQEPVSAIMARNVVCVETEDTIEKVVFVMNSRKLSFVPVSDQEGNAFGIITASQVEHFLAAKKNPKLVRAWEMCTYKPLQADPHLAIMEVARMMVQNHVHYLIVTENAAIVGVVSSLDILKRYLLKENHLHSSRVLPPNPGRGRKSRE